MKAAPGDPAERTWAHLLEEARARIPLYAPEWTDHNPSDPGITLVELLAWLTEMLLYRADRVTDESYRAFLSLLNGGNPLPDRDLQRVTRSTIQDLRKLWRAVTPKDIEDLVREQWIEKPDGTKGPVARVAVGKPERETIRVFVLPTRDEDHVAQDIETGLAPRRLLGAVIEVREARRVALKVTAAVRLLDRVEESAVRTRALQALNGFFDPLHGGRNGTGWPFGRVRLADLDALLDAVEGVDYVVEVEVRKIVAGAEESEPRRPLTSIAFGEEELPFVEQLDIG